MKETAETMMPSRDSTDVAVPRNSTALTEAVRLPRGNSNSIKTTEPAWFAALMVVVAMALRPGIASIGPVLPSISRALSLSHAMASLLATVPIFMLGLLALPATWLAARYGTSEILLASLVTLFVSMAARPFASNFAELLLSTVGVGAGIAVAGTLFGGMIKSRFPTRVAMMMSLYAMSLSVSSALSAAATGPIAALAGKNGWRLGTGIWAIVALIAVFAGMAIHGQEARTNLIPTTKAAPGAPLPVTHQKAWLIALFLACDNFLFFALLSWLSAIYLEQGYSEPSANAVLATYTVSFTIGISVFGSLSRAHDRRWWLALCAGLAATGTLGVASAPRLLPHLSIAVAAFGLGGGLTLGMTLPLDNAQRVDDVNAWNAFVLTVGYLVAAIGPLVVGLLRDLTGSFNTPVWLAYLVALVMLALTPFLAPRPHHFK